MVRYSVSANSSYIFVLLIIYKKIFRRRDLICKRETIYTWHREFADAYNCEVWGISSTFLSSTFLWGMVFSRPLTSLSVFALVFLFPCSPVKSFIVPSRGANLDTSLSSQKAAHLLLSTAKIEQMMYFHSRSLFWLVASVFRTDFTQAFSHV